VLVVFVISILPALYYDVFFAKIKQMIGQSLATGL